MEQMASQIRQIKSVSYRSRGLVGVSYAVTPQNQYWLAPGSTRTETTSADGTTVLSVVIHPAGKPGIEINHLSKTYCRLPARLGPASETEDWSATTLGQLSGPADRDLGTKKIDGRPAQGLSTTDRNPPGATIEAWIDPESKLPIVVDVSWDAFGHNIQAPRISTFGMRNSTRRLFVAEPPADYADSTPTHPAC